jgi:hypothetical protein
MHKFLKNGAENAENLYQHLVEQEGAVQGFTLDALLHAHKTHDGPVPMGFITQNLVRCAQEDGDDAATAATAGAAGAAGVEGVYTAVEKKMHWLVEKGLMLVKFFGSFVSVTKVRYDGMLVLLTAMCIAYTSPATPSQATSTLIRKLSTSIHTISAGRDVRADVLLLHECAALLSPPFHGRLLPSDHGLHGQLVHLARHNTLLADGGRADDVTPLQTVATFGEGVGLGRDMVATSAATHRKR